MKFSTFVRTIWSIVRRHPARPSTDRYKEPSHTSSKLPELPIEIWEMVIDHLWNDPGSLAVCALVCKSWSFRCLFHLRGKLLVRDRNVVVQAAKRLRAGLWEAETIEEVTIRSDGPGHQAIPQLVTFAAIFARRLTCLQELTIEWATLETSATWMHADVFLHLSAFTSITRLRLNHVVFPTVAVFGRLIFALSNLTYLRCVEVGFDNGGFRAASFPRRPHPKLAYLSLATNLPHALHDVVEFLVVTDIASTLKEIRLGDPSLPIQAHSARAYILPSLLCAASTSLHQLNVYLSGDHAKRLSCALPDGLEPASTLHDLLVQVPNTGEKLHEVCIVVDVLDNSGETIIQSLLERELDSQQCSLIDDAFSSPKFSSLERVVFQIRCYLRYALPEESEWRQRLSSRLPKLSATGVLRTSITARNIPE